MKRIRRLNDQLWQNWWADPDVILWVVAIAVFVGALLYANGS